MGYYPYKDSYRRGEFVRARCTFSFPVYALYYPNVQPNGCTPLHLQGETNRDPQKPFKRWGSCLAPVYIIFQNVNGASCRGLGKRLSVLGKEIQEKKEALEME